MQPAADGPAPRVAHGQKVPAPPYGALTLLRHSHRERVLALLRTDGPSSRAALARKLGLSPSTLTNIAATLVAAGSVVEVEPTGDMPRTRGRPGTLLALSSSAGTAVGIDFAHRRVRVCIANLAHEVVGSAAQSHGEKTPWLRRVTLAVELIERISAEHDVDLSGLQGIGVGLVGPGDEHVTRAEIVTADLRQRFGVPVMVDNNANLAALAESKWGVAAGLRNVMYVRLSQGVGGALVLDGRILHGASGAAGEFGHICVDPDGPPCWCGRHGCLECYLSVPALLAAWRPGRTVAFSALLEALNTGEPTARKVIVEAGQRLGRVLAGLCNALNPDDLVISGEVAAAGAALLDPVRTSLKEQTLPISYRHLHLRTAQLGDDDCALGAIAWVLQNGARSPIVDQGTGE